MAKQFSLVVRDVYDAAVSASGWPHVMEAVARTLDATAAAIVTERESHRELQCTVLPDEAQTSYRNRYGALDYVLADIESGPTGLVRSGREVIGQGAGSEFDADWLSPYGMGDGLFVRLRATPCPTSFVVAASRCQSSFATVGRIRWVNALVPHLQNALRTQDALFEAVRQRDELAEALDATPAGVVVVDAHARIVHANLAAEAILAKGDGLLRNNGRLRGLSSLADQGLTRAIGLATSVPVPRGTGLQCRRVGRPGAYVINVTPLCGHDDGALAGRALIVLIDPDRDRKPPAELLRQLFGLTAAESAVALLIISGYGVRAAADELSVSQTTVRTHLQRVYGKTGAHTQAQLANLIGAFGP